MNACSNTEGDVKGGPPESKGCIIGQALKMQGLDLTDYPDFDRSSIHIIAEVFNTDLLHENPRNLHFRTGIHEKIIDWLGIIQSKQDAKHTWGSALTEANKTLSYTEVLTILKELENA